MKDDQNLALFTVNILYDFHVMFLPIRTPCKDYFLRPRNIMLYYLVLLSCPNPQLSMRQPLGYPEVDSVYTCLTLRHNKAYDILNIVISAKIDTYLTQVGKKKVI